MNKSQDDSTRMTEDDTDLEGVSRATIQQNSETESEPHAPDPPDDQPHQDTGTGAESQGKELEVEEGKSNSQMLEEYREVRNQEQADLEWKILNSLFQGNFQMYHRSRTEGIRDLFKLNVVLKKRQRVIDGK